MVCRRSTVPLEGGELPELSAAHGAEAISHRLTNLWESERSKAKPSLFRALACLIARPMIAGNLVGCVNGVLSAVIRPLILRAVIQSISARSDSVPDEAEETWFGWSGVVWDCLGVVAIATVIAFEGLTQVHTSKLVHEDAGVMLCSGLSTLLLDATLFTDHNAAPAEARLHAARRKARCGAKETARGADSAVPAGLSPAALAAADVTRLYAAFYPLSFLPLAITSITGGTIVLVFTIGVLPALAGWGVLTLILGVNFALSKVTQVFERRSLEWSDKRLGALRHIIDGIKTVKLFRWEENYLEHVSELRKHECKEIRNMRLLQSTAIASGRAAPILSSMAAILLWAVISDELDAANAFAAIAVFQALRMAFIVLPIALTAVFNIALSTGRLQRYLTLPRHPERVTFVADNGSDHVLRFKRVALSWAPDIEAARTAAPAAQRPEEVAAAAEGRDAAAASKAPAACNGPSPPTLRDVTFTLGRGEVVAVVGAVGSGKSTLISAAVGALAPRSGVVDVEESIASTAYVPQVAKIFSGSIYDNVLLGRAYDAALFDDAIARASFDEDLPALPNGIDTLIGERGCTLSGGQQQRLAIARSLYARPELLIFDDALSAVDAAVAEKLFVDAVLGSVGLGRGSTAGRGAGVLIAMNQLDLLPRVHRVVFVAEGEATVGTFDELVATCPGFAALIAAHRQSQQGDDGASGKDGESGAAKESGAAADDVLAAGVAEAKGETEDLAINVFAEGTDERAGEPAAAVKASPGLETSRAAPASLAAPAPDAGEVGGSEVVKTGVVAAKTWLVYFRSIGALPFVFTLLVTALAYVAMVCADVVLTLWLGKGVASWGVVVYGVSDLGYAALYVAGVLLFVTLLMSGSYLWCLLGERASRSLHFDAMKRLLNAPLFFFNTNASGRIFSRLGNDLLVVDTWISLFMDNAAQFVFNLLAFLLTLLLLAPSVVVLVPGAFALYVLVVELVDREFYFIYRYILRESCSQFDSLPLTSLTISPRSRGELEREALSEQRGGADHLEHRREPSGTRRDERAWRQRVAEGAPVRVRRGLDALRVRQRLAHRVRHALELLCFVLLERRLFGLRDRDAALRRARRREAHSRRRGARDRVQLSSPVLPLQHGLDCDAIKDVHDVSGASAHDSRAAARGECGGGGGGRGGGRGGARRRSVAQRRSDCVR
jgi:ABC-type multidrug transport system fused ATPase/permease subunit